MQARYLAGLQTHNPNISLKGFLMKCLVGMLLTLMIVLPIFAQDADADVAKYVALLDQGKADQVKSDLPSLVAKHQTHPGVLYLQGRLAADGVEAMKLYQSIIDNFPKSQWADDALYFTYQYYFSLGLYRTADLKLQQLKKEYPSSPYATGKATTKTLPKDEPQPRVVGTTPAEPPRTTPVQPVTPPTSTRNDAPQPSPDQSGAYAIQVGAFSTMANAEKLKTYFEDLGYQVETQNKVRGGRSLFLVWVGSFSSADDARRFGEEIKRKHNVESIVVTR